MQAPQFQAPHIQASQFQPQFQGPQMQGPQMQGPQFQAGVVAPKPTNYLPLVLILAGLLLVAIALVVFFALRG